MSASSSDSEDSWALVNPLTLSQGSDSSSHSSQYVEVDGDIAEYHHRQDVSDNVPETNEEPYQQEMNKSEDVGEDKISDNSETTLEANECSQEFPLPSCSDQFDNAAADDVKEPMDLLASSSICAITEEHKKLRDVEMLPLPHISSEFKSEVCENEGLAEDDSCIQESCVTEAATVPSAEQCSAAFSDVDSDIEDASSMEQLAAKREEPTEKKRDDWEILRHTRPTFRPGPMLRIHSSGGSDSASDHSDFVRLDRVDDNAAPLFAGEMQASTSSSASSISHSFRFVRPVQRPPHYRHQYQHNDANDADDDDDDSLPPDVDDRCESDISGVADDQSDLSEAALDLGDLMISEGDVVRSYKHWPNASLNTMLTFMTLITVFLAMGVGIGHYTGTVRETSFRKKQIEQIKALQDDYLMCLRQQEIDKDKYDNIPHMEERVSLVAEEWRENYEEMILEKVELEQKIQKLEKDQLLELMMAQDQVANSQSQIDILQSELGRLNTNALAIQKMFDVEVADALKQQQDEEMHLETKQNNIRLEDALQEMTKNAANLEQQLRSEQEPIIFELRNELNQLKIENSDLRKVVSQQRYTHHPSNTIDQNPANISMNILNDTPKLNPNYEKKIKVMEVNQSSYEDTHKELLLLHDRLHLANIALQEQRFKSARLRTLLLAAKQRFRNGSESHNFEEPDFFTCFLYLLPNINLTEGLSPVLEGTTDLLKQHIEFLRRLKEDSGFTTTFNTKFKEIKGYIESTNWEMFTDQANGAFADMHRSIVKKWQEFDSAKLDDISNTIHEEWRKFNITAAAKSVKDKVREVKSTLSNLKDRVKSTVGNMTSGDKLQTVYNTTKQSVSKLSKRIQTTWDEVKNLSSELLEKTPGVKQISDNIGNFGHKMHKNWKFAQKKIEKGWFKKNEKKGKKKKGKKTTRSQYKPNINEEPLFSDESMGQKFENKPPHKQKQSTRSEPDAYEEFWKRADFTPDDLIPDGFLEGNNREWRKHQKRLKKLHGRIQKLNEEIFHSLDDDDIDDMYDDLDDLQDDVEDEDNAPEELKNWLTCQTRWWKSRLYRKHRTQDLVKGCGQQLMKWQLRVLCKPRCKGSRCYYDHSSLDSFCQYYQTVILSQEACSVVDPNCAMKRVIPSIVNNQNGYNDHGADQTIDSADWYFERAQERDLHHDSVADAHDIYVGFNDGGVYKTSGRWLFERSVERDFVRSKPWYYHRAEQRQNHHLLRNMPEKMHDKFRRP